jgi:hypothetical protein
MVPIVLPRLTLTGQPLPRRVTRESRGIVASHRHIASEGDVALIFDKQGRGGGPEHPQHGMNADPGVLARVRPRIERHQSCPLIGLRRVAPPRRRQRPCHRAL